MSSTPTFHLYLDDSGTRCPFKGVKIRRDHMDWFALGGLLLRSETLDRLNDLHRELCKKYDIQGPLHSNSIRGKRRDFTWMDSDPDRALEFLGDLTGTIRAVPGNVIACVIHRPGYNVRYGQVYGDNRWSLCKTAYRIVVERAVKIAIENGRRLLVHVERTGKREDRMILDYHRGLRTTESYFDPNRSSKYEPVTRVEFERCLFSEPKFFDKSNPAGQLSDLLVYPVVKGRYDPSYLPYVDLKESKKLVDELLEPSTVATRGIKYSCFDGI
jgi:hypothetical protein